MNILSAQKTKSPAEVTFVIPGGALAYLSSQKGEWSIGSS